MPSSPCAHKPSALRAAVCRCRRSLPCAPSASASRATSVGSLHAICPCQLTVQCPSTSPQTTRQRTAQHLLSLQATCRRSAQQMVAPCKPFVDAPCTTICCPPAQHLPSLTHHPSLLLAQHPLTQADALIPLRTKPSSRTDTLNPRKNTLCAIVNCPLQIKPVFYFSFTSYRAPCAPHSRKIKFAAFRALLPCACHLHI